MEFKGTQGKWIQSHRQIPNDKKGMYATQVYTEDGETIATLSWCAMPPKPCVVNGKSGFVTESYREANAKLIAASPLLLEALQGLIRWTAHFPQAMNEEIQAALNAIQKAT